MFDLLLELLVVLVFEDPERQELDGIRRPLLEQLRESLRETDRQSPAHVLRVHPSKRSTYETAVFTH